jgi:acylphosphatase
MERLHAQVYGEVQGVGFRRFVVDEAQRIGVVGWVRNRWDDSVEVMAEGERAALGQLLEVLRRGPRQAEVETVTEDWLPATDEFKQFWILQTE